MGKKICSRCHIEKDIEEFYGDKSHIDEHRSHCKLCEKAIYAKNYLEHIEQRKVSAAKYRLENSNKVKLATVKWQKEHPEKVRASKTKYRLAHPEQAKVAVIRWQKEHLEQVRTNSIKWRKEHLEQKKARDAKYYLENIEKIKVRSAEYAKTEKGKLVSKVTNHRRRAAGNITTTQVKEIKNFNNGICPYCLRPVKIGHLDHVVPIVRGGKSEIGNYAWVCVECNQGKGVKDLEFFLTEQTALGRRMQSFDRICIYGHSYQLTIQPKYDIVLLNQ